jgi:hypothetical protein
LEGDPPAVVTSLIAHAQTMGEADAGRFSEAVFADLPPEAAQALSYRGAVMSAQYMYRVFTARSRGARPQLHDWLHGVRHAPGWLTNRGVWSILVRDILLGRGAGAGGAGASGAGAGAN